ncbi:hypothetical protein GQ42DRAFT_83145 [Ramicandelaber brevisporus]|nr:hypothetical protein GQ42DRAFT_83145 [Ramicandelaber brevisporus]
MAVVRALTFAHLVPAVTVAVIQDSSTRHGARLARGRGACKTVAVSWRWLCRACSVGSWFWPGSNVWWLGGLFWWC